MLLFQNFKKKQCFKKNLAKEHVFFGRKRKQIKFLFENCKCFFTKEIAKSLFLLESLPRFIGFEPSFISFNFDNFFMNDNHSLFAVDDKVFEYS